MTKTYDLEERTLAFAKGIIRLCRKIPKEDVANSCLAGQLIRAASSVGANYREANEALGKKDFTYRLKLARKECKESSYWLALLGEANGPFLQEIVRYLNAAKELRNILSSIIRKSA
jgi:four helix bundle protein